MPSSHYKFFLSIVAPSILAILLFIISFWVVIIPQFEKNMMENKKEMILELTQTVWSILQEQHYKYQTGEITLTQAKQNAAYQVELMRYGKERKDYFWIIDQTPQMVMHPYRKELNDKNLSDFKDSHEKKLFVDAANLVKAKGEGFIDYYWQWKDDTAKVVPKLSYVKGFEPWLWIIGTGIYLDDVNREMTHLKNRLVIISSIIIAIIILALIYLVRQSLIIENKRKAAEQKLMLSKQKYKTLVEASTDGTLMFINGKVVFHNLKFASMYACKSVEIIGQPFGSLFMIDWNEVLNLFTDPNKSVSTETKLKCYDKPDNDVVISVSKIDYSNTDAYIVIVKDLSRQKILEKGAQKLSEELHTSLLLMNQPINSFVTEHITCALNTPIKNASELMSTRNQKIIFVTQNNIPVGAVNQTDLNKRVLSTGLNPETAVSEIMSAPLVYIAHNALLYEAVLLFKSKRVSHLLVKNTDGKIMGCISNQATLEMQRNALSYLVQEIETSGQIEELKQIYNRLPLLVNALIVNTHNAQNITRIVTSVADTIAKRVIFLALQTHGEPPCNFAFITMGSEGRKEQTLKTDQDNALVFIDTVNNENHKVYFNELANTITKNLHFIGYNLCEGDVMASNKKWCNPLEEWKKLFSSWIETPDPQNILDSSIFFDFRCIYGDEALIEELRQHVNERVKQNSLFFYHMSQSVIKFKSTSGNEEYNLKKILLPLVGFARTYSLLHQISETNTPERLELLNQKNIITEEEKNEWVQIYNFLMQLRLKHQSAALLNHEIPENTIEPKTLSNIELNTLKKSIAEIAQLQTQLSLDFK